MTPRKSPELLLKKHPETRLPKPPEIVGLSFSKLTPEQRKIYWRWQDRQHCERKNKKQKEYRQKNAEKRALSQKKWRAANPNYCREYMKAWYGKNGKAAQARFRAKQLVDPKYIEKQALIQQRKQDRKDKRIFEESLAKVIKTSLRLHREERNKMTKWQQAIQANPDHKIRSTVRARIRKLLKGLAKGDTTMGIIGCTIAELKRHLESQFKGSMSWENYGKTWHIDHVVPCSYFDFTKVEEVRRCFHFTNLRPLWAKANMRQQDRRGHLTPYLMMVA